jgi:hypothetical protein
MVFMNKVFQFSGSHFIRLPEKNNLYKMQRPNCKFLLDAIKKNIYFMLTCELNVILYSIFNR